jgi:phosphatidate cytidylyltransferase
MSAVRTRLVIGLSIAGVALGLIIVDWLLDAAWAMTVMVAFCTSVALHEFYTMVRHKNIYPLWYIGIPLAVLMLFGEYFINHFQQLGKWHFAHLQLLVLFIGVFLIFLVRMIRQKVEKSLADIAVTVFGIIYIWGLSSFILRLRFLKICVVSNNVGPDIYVDVGMFLILLLIVVAKLNDSTAYFVGRSLGKRKLAPKISPNKSVEGLVGGLIGGIAGAFVVYSIFPEGRLFGPVFVLVFALLVGAASHLGDLAESMLKRDVGVKDSAALFPEAGGFLDLIDGLLFASPVAFFVTVFLSTARFHTTG